MKNRVNPFNATLTEKLLAVLVSFIMVIPVLVTLKYFGVDKDVSIFGCASLTLCLYFLILYKREQLKQS